MTPENWKKVEVALQYPFGSASLLVDGYQLTLKVEQVKALKYVIRVYVNGWMKGEWLLKDCDERRRFCCPKQSFARSRASKAKLTKGLGKRAVAKYFPDIDKKFTWYTSGWSSFGALKRHLVANNGHIELQEITP